MARKTIKTWKFRYADLSSKVFSLNENGEKIDFEKAGVFEGTQAEATNELCRRAILYEEEKGNSRLLRASTEEV